MTESIDKDSEGGFLEDTFDDSERAALKTAFERGDHGALVEQLDAKGVTTDADRQEILESLAGENVETGPRDLRERLSDLELPDAGHYSTQPVPDNRVLLDYVIRPDPAGEDALPGMNFTLKMAILMVVNALRATNTTVTRKQFRNMVGATYKALLRWR